MKKTIEQLKAEYLDMQAWQFVSLDEWLAAHLEAHDAE